MFRRFSVKFLLPNFEIIALLQLLTNRSQKPPKCGAPDWLNFQLIGPCASNSLMLDWLQWFMCFLINLAAPTKLVSLSEMIVWGFPLLLMNLVFEAKHASAYKLGTPSMCTAIVLYHLLRLRRKTLTSSGPKYSIPLFWNGNTFPAVRSSGRLAMRGYKPVAICLHRTPHFELMFRSPFLMPTIEFLGDHSLLQERFLNLRETLSLTSLQQNYFSTLSLFTSDEFFCCLIGAELPS